MLPTLLLWCAIVLAFVAGLVTGSWLQERHDAKRFRQVENALRRAALARLLKFPTARELAERAKRPDFNIVKGFDNDD